MLFHLFLEYACYFENRYKVRYFFTLIIDFNINQFQINVLSFYRLSEIEM